MGRRSGRRLQGAKTRGPVELARCCSLGLSPVRFDGELASQDVPMAFRHSPCMLPLISRECSGRNEAFDLMRNSLLDSSDGTCALRIYIFRSRNHCRPEVVNLPRAACASIGVTAVWILKTASRCGGVTTQSRLASGHAVGRLGPKSWRPKTVSGRSWSV
jgi:hypothetical protein